MSLELSHLPEEIKADMGGLYKFKPQFTPKGWPEGGKEGRVDCFIRLCFRVVL